MKTLTSNQTSRKIPVFIHKLTRFEIHLRGANITFQIKTVCILKMINLNQNEIYEIEYKLLTDFATLACASNITPVNENVF